MAIMAGCYVVLALECRGVAEFGAVADLLGDDAQWDLGFAG